MWRITYSSVVLCLLVTIFWEEASARPREAERGSPMKFIPEIMFEPSMESAASPATLNQYPYYPSYRGGDNGNSGGPPTGSNYRPIAAGQAAPYAQGAAGNDKLPSSTTSSFRPAAAANLNQFPYYSLYRSASAGINDYYPLLPSQATLNGDEIAGDDNKLHSSSSSSRLAAINLLGNAILAGAGEARSSESPAISNTMAKTDPSFEDDSQSSLDPWDDVGSDIAGSSNIHNLEDNRLFDSSEDNVLQHSSMLQNDFMLTNELGNNSKPKSKNVAEDNSFPQQRNGHEDLAAMMDVDDKGRLIKDSVDDQENLEPQDVGDEGYEDKFMTEDIDDEGLGELLSRYNHKPLPSGMEMVENDQLDEDSGEELDSRQFSRTRVQYTPPRSLPPSSSPPISTFPYLKPPATTTRPTTSKPAQDTIPSRNSSYGTRLKEDAILTNSATTLPPIFPYLRPPPASPVSTQPAQGSVLSGGDDGSRPTQNAIASSSAYEAKTMKDDVMSNFANILRPAKDPEMHYSTTVNSAEIHNSDAVDRDSAERTVDEDEEDKDNDDVDVDNEMPTMFAHRDPPTVAAEKIKTSNNYNNPIKHNIDSYTHNINPNSPNVLSDLNSLSESELLTLWKEASWAELDDLDNPTDEAPSPFQDINEELGEDDDELAQNVVELLMKKPKVPNNPRMTNSLQSAWVAERRNGWSPSQLSGKGAYQQADQGKEPRKDLLIGLIFETIGVADNVFGEMDHSSQEASEADLWQVYQNFPFHMRLGKTYVSAVYFDDDDDDDDDDDYYEENNDDDDDDYYEEDNDDDDVDDGNTYDADLLPPEEDDEYDYTEYEDYDDEECEDCDEDDNKGREPNDEFTIITFFK